MIKSLKWSGSVFFHLLKTLETRPEAGGWGWPSLRGWATEGSWLRLLTLAKDPEVYSMLSWLHIHISLYVVFPGTPENWSIRGQHGSRGGGGGGKEGGISEDKEGQEDPSRSRSSERLLDIFT